MKVRTVKSILIAVGLALAIPLAAQARPMMQGNEDCYWSMPMFRQMRGGPDGSFPGMRGLNLTEVQRDQIAALHKVQIPLMQEKAKVLSTARSDLHALSFAETFDEQRAKALADTSAQALSEMAQLRAKNHHAVMLLLTPEQRQIWKERIGRFGLGRGVQGWPGMR